MRAYIIANDGTERTASLHEAPPLAKAWIQWTKNLVEQAVTPIRIHVDGDAAGPGPLYRSLAKALQHGDWTDLARACKGPGPALIVSPFAGCLSRKRMQDFISLFLSMEAPAVLRSRYKVDANTNPLWLRALPHDDFAKSAAYVPWESFKFKTDPRTYCQMVDQHHAVPDILGSQHLPAMYTNDDTLVGLARIPQNQAVEEEYHYYDKEADDSLLPLYRIGITNLHPRQRIAMIPVLAGNIGRLLEPAGGSECLAGAL